MLANLLRIVLILFIIYFTYRFFRALFLGNKILKDNVKNKTYIKKNRPENDNVIELNKDQYKVEE